VAQLLVVALCLLAGLLLRRRPGLPLDATAAALNTFVIHVPLPALVLRQVSGLSLGPEVLVPALVPWVVFGVSIGLVLAVSRVFAFPRPLLGALLLVVPLGNTSFVGLPLTLAWLGPEAVPWALLYDQLGSFLALATWGTWVVATFGEGAGVAGPPGASKIIRKIVMFPPFVALVTAVGLSLTLSGGLPPVVAEALDLVSKALVPAVLVAVGLKWQLRLAAADAGPLAVALALKLVAAPLVAWGVLKAVGVHGLHADATVLEAGMGPMLTACALALGAGLRPSLVAAVAGYGTLASLGSTGLVRLLLLPV
jgi:predicted permease